MASAPIYVGVGGWVFEPWRGSFYPPGLTHKRELEYASRALTSIEINGTYHGSQKPESFARWHDETPSDFVFAVKGPRFTTNRRVLAEAGASIERFFASGVTQLKNKLGPINWQFLPTKAFDPADFEAFLKLLPRSVDGHNIRHAVEVRHDSFGTPEFVSLARAYDVGIVVAGDSEFPQIADRTAPFVYVRMMGTEEANAAGYAEDALHRWTLRLQALASGRPPEGLRTLGADKAPASPAPVFAYVIGGAKVRNPLAAAALVQRVGNPRARPIPAPVGGGSSA